MAARGVVGFELVGVQQQQAHRKTVTLRTLDLFDKSFLEIASIEKSGQRVGHRELFEFTGFVFQDRAVDSDGDLRRYRLEQLQITFIESLPGGLVGKVHYSDPPLADKDRVAEER